jgi:hypothetical protein
MPTYEAGDYVQVEFQDETMFSRAMFFALETRREQNIQLTSVAEALANRFNQCQLRTDSRCL